MTENYSMFPKYTLQVLSPNDLEEKHIAAWLRLEANAIEANAFLSPYFVLPAIRHLEKDKQPLILFVKKNSISVHDLVGVVIFNTHKPDLKFPLPYLSLFSSIHSYLSGFLVDREHAYEVTEEIYRYIKNPKHGWHGLRVKNLTADGEYVSIRQAVESSLGVTWQSSRSWKRPVCYPPKTTEADIFVSKKTKENIQRRQRGLSKLGDVEWNVYSGERLKISHFEDLLRLEHTGWKKDKGTSLLSSQDNTAFFREMSLGFQSEERVFITELRVNGELLSTVSNLMSGESGFSFKIGWDASYSRYSPLIINMTNYIANKTSLPSCMVFLDSCSEPDSHMEDIWSNRRALADGLYALTGSGRLALAAIHTIKQAKGRLLQRKEKV